MKKPVQILIFLALLPFGASAREETLEERKQRIVRKYLRERATISQSIMVVPSDFQEDERVTDSEKFKTPEVDLQRQEGPAAQVVQPPPPRPVPRADENWLLQGTDETAELDMYGNPADPSMAETDYWSAWGGTDREPKETSKSTRRYDPYARDERGTAGDSRLQQDPRSRSDGFSSFSREGSDLFGNRATSPAPMSGFGVQSTPRTFGSSPNGMLSTPYERSRSSGEPDAEKEQYRNYQPYKSPYQQQREERSQTPAYSSPDSPRQEYKRPDSYQQWKSRQNQYDPTSDDAYINEMMKPDRR